MTASIPIVTAVSRAAISEPNCTGPVDVRDRRRAAGQREAGERHHGEDGAPGEIQRGEERDVPRHAVTATRTSTRVRGPRGGKTLKLKRSPSETPGGTETVRRW